MLTLEAKNDGAGPPKCDFRLQPYVTDHVHNDHTWLHPPCSTEWFEARRTLAASELAKLGIAMLGGES